MADNLAQRVIFRCKDQAGKIGTTALMIPTDTGADPIDTLTGFATVFNAISDAIIVGRVGETSNNEGFGSSASNVYDVRDKLAVEYVGSQNDHHTIMVGDLDPAILLANDENVDPANAAWLALVTGIEGNVKDKAGEGVSVIRGYRQRSRNLKSSMLYL